MSKGEKREKEKEREANQGKDSTIENKLLVTRGEMCVGGAGWVKQVMGIKDCSCDEHWVTYGSTESWHLTLETSITLYVI